MVNSFSKVIITFIFTLGLFLLPNFVTAKKRKTQYAQVVVPEAAIYSKPHFDAKVLAVLKSGKRVLISKKIYKGIGGLGAFYKVRVKKGVIGYITDVDVKNGSKRKPNPKKKINKKSQQQPPQPQNSRPDDPMYFTSYLGLAFSQINYTEKLLRKKVSERLNFFGLKRTGSTGILGGLPLDLDILFYFAPPPYYNSIANGASSGLIIHANMILTIPFYEGQNYLFTYGAGPVLNFSNIATKIQSKTYDATDLRVGIAGDLGGAFKVGRHWVIKVNSRYYLEKSQYSSFILSVQHRYR